MIKDIRNFSLNAIPFLVGILPSIILIPIYLKFIGSEGLGVYYLYLSLVGIGGTFDFGIPQTIIKYIAEYRGLSEKFIQLTIYSTKLVISLVHLIVIFSALLLCIIISETDLFGNISVLSVVLFTAGIILQMWYSFFISILQGYEKFKKIAVIDIQNKFLFSILGIFCAFYFQDVNYVIISHIFSLLLFNYFLMRNAVYFQNEYNYKLKLQFFKKRLWNYSKWILTQNTIGFLNTNIDKFIVASFVSLSSLAVYNTAKNISNLVPAFFGKGFGYLLPHISRMNDISKIKKLYVKYSYIINSILALFYLIGIIISEPILLFYLKNDPELANQVIVVFKYLLISSVFMSTSLLSFYLFNGIGQVKINTTIPFLGNLLSITVVIVFGYFYGFWGVVFARLSNVLFSVIVRTYTYNKVFKEKDYLFGLKVALPIVISITLIEIIFS